MRVTPVTPRAGRPFGGHDQALPHHPDRRRAGLAGPRGAGEGGHPPRARRRPKNVATGGGLTAWATPEGDGFRLVLRTADGTLSTPDIPAFATAPDPTIGSTGPAAAGFDGRQVLVLYSREDDSGARDIYALNPARASSGRSPGCPAAATTRRPPR